MRSILCFGDSNTWGYDAATEGRLPWHVRWPGVLQRLLGPEVRVVEEGLNGRSTMFDRPEQPSRNGNAVLPMLLETHAPLDDVVVAIGINDLFVPGITPRWSARGIESILLTIEQSASGPAGAVPRVLVVAPPPITTLPEAWAMDAPGATVASHDLPTAFRYVCDPLGVPVLDLTGVVEPDPIDGEHFTAQGHAAIAAAVAAALGPA
jgi:lysophospholipase L1-like esterase